MRPPRRCSTPPVWAGARGCWTWRAEPAARRLAAARRTGPAGSVVVTDLSPGHPRYAERAAAEAGLRHVTTAERRRRGARQPWSRSSTRSSAGWASSTSPTRRERSPGIRASLRDGGRFAADRLLDRRPQRRSSRCRSAHPRARRPRRTAARTAGPVQPRRTPRRAADALRRRGLPRRRRPDLSAPLRLRVGRGVRRASSASRSARSTRCCPASPEDEREQVVGRTSRRRWRQYEDRRRVRRTVRAARAVGDPMTGRFTVAAVQAAYVLLDRDATVTRVEELVAEAAGPGAELVVLPEAFIPGTPLWIDSVRIWDGDGPGTPASSTRRSSCRARPPRGSGAAAAPPASTSSSGCRSANRTATTIYNTMLYFGPDGAAARQAPQAGADRRRADRLGPGRRVDAGGGADRRSAGSAG